MVIREEQGNNDLVYFCRPLDFISQEITTSDEMRILCSSKNNKKISAESFFTIPEILFDKSEKKQEWNEYGEE